MNTFNRRALILLGAVAILSTPACARVKPEEMQAALADLRVEMNQGDEANAQRVNQLNSRVDGLESRMSSLEQELRTMGEEFDATVERMESAIRFNTPIYFGFDDAAVQSQYRPLLERFASVVNQYYPDATITVEGFTDRSGSEAYNLRLGQRRADAVKDYLAGQGLSAERLKAVSYGKNTQRLVTPGATGPGQSGWENRRVVLVIDHAASAMGTASISDSQD
jgi:peptidoglycan-associated lipoprotein